MLNCTQLSNNKEQTSFRIGFTYDIYETEKEETLKNILRLRENEMKKHV